MQQPAKNLRNIKREGFKNIAFNYLYILAGTVSRDRGIALNMLSVGNNSDIAKQALLYHICNLYINQTGENTDVFPYEDTKRGGLILFSEKIATRINDLLASEKFKQALEKSDPSLLTGEEAFSYLLGVFIENMNHQQLYFYNNLHQFYLVHAMLMQCSGMNDSITTKTTFLRPTTYSILLNNDHPLLPAYGKP
ncbi:MAG TPA: hypothetical protein PLW44_07350 [Chitinophagales bacterium]|nr:hypothetical protein [Chitinophagales bacterium]